MDQKPRRNPLQRYRVEGKLVSFSFSYSCGLWAHCSTPVSCATRGRSHHLWQHYEALEGNRGFELFPAWLEWTRVSISGKEDSVTITVVLYLRLSWKFPAVPWHFHQVASNTRVFGIQKRPSLQDLDLPIESGSTSSRPEWQRPKSWQSK